MHISTQKATKPPSPPNNLYLYKHIVVMDTYACDVFIDKDPPSVEWRLPSVAYNFFAQSTQDSWQKIGNKTNEQIKEGVSRPIKQLMVAPRKSTSGSSSIPQEKSRNMPSSSKSTESLYSNTSSSKGSATVLYRKTASTNARSAGFIPATSDVRQRVLSARRLRMKTFQNQLADAQQHITELAHENRMLRTLHRRQDLALAKYESSNAELPQLLHSHAEEIRVWQAKYRNLQSQNRELINKLKQKEAVILTLTDQNKRLTQLNNDRNLEERQRLADKVQKLEILLQEKETDMKLLARRLQLESKNSKKELQSEQKKRKDAQVQLEKVKLELSGYVKIDELNMNERLSKICIGSTSNLSNAIQDKDDKSPLSKNQLLLLDKKENCGDQSNRSACTDRSDGYVSTGRTAKKLVGKTSTHRGNGDGIVEDEQSNFLRREPNADSQTDIDSIDSKLDQHHFYEDDFECTDKAVDPSEKKLGLKTVKDEDMGYLRREITEDYKQRESFLDTFCRQPSADSNRVDVNRKSKLLAALKAIEGSSSKE